MASEPNIIPPNPINEKIVELEQLQKQIRTWRTITIVTVIAVVVICVGLISHSVSQLAHDGPEQKEFMNELAAGLQTDVLPTVQQIAGQTANQLIPAIKIEVQKMNDRAPELVNAARKELELLGNNMSVKSEKTLDKTFGDALKKREGKIKEMFPEVTEQRIATLTANLTTVAQEKMTGVAHSLFSGHILALNKITENMQEIYKAEEKNLVTEDVPAWEVALLFFDVFREDLNGAETLSKKIAAK